jgi:hypothetical protein
MAPIPIPNVSIAARPSGASAGQRVARRPAASPAASQAATPAQSPAPNAIDTLPADAAPIEVIRGLHRTIALPSPLPGQPMIEVAPQDVAGGNWRDTLRAMQQGAIDRFSPVEAKTRQGVQVEQQRGQSMAEQARIQGSAHTEGALISAGPHYAGVQQRREESAARLSHEKEQANKPVRVSGGQEMQTDATGMPVIVRTPDMIYDPKTNEFKRPNIAETAPKLPAEEARRQALDAVARGANKDAVNARLRAGGYRPI